MLYRILLILGIMHAKAGAAIQWDVDSALSKFAEDSLMIHLTSDLTLPRMDLRFSDECTTAINDVSLRGIAGTGWSSSKSVKTAFWKIPPFALPAGPLCLQPYDSGNNQPLAEAKLILRPSRYKHKLVGADSLFPWTFRWSRPSSIPWTRVKIGSRDKATGKEWTHSDLWTRNLEASLDIANHDQYWVRLANAYDSSATATDTNSWVVFPLPIKMDSLLPPLLLSPKSGATFTRSQIEDGIEFTWSIPGVSAETRLLVYQYEGKGWTLVYNFPTTLQHFKLPVSGLTGGRYQWVVSYQDSRGRIGNSPPREFNLNGELLEYKIQIWVNNRPTNNAIVYCTPANGQSSQILKTSSHNGEPGIILFKAEPGNALIELREPGNTKEIMEIDLPLNSTEVIPLSFETSQTGTLSGIVCDDKKLPLVKHPINLQHSSGESVVVHTGFNGEFHAVLQPGEWHWKVAPFDSGTILIQRNNHYQLDTIVTEVSWIVLQGFTEPATTIEALSSLKGKSWSTRSSQNGFFQLSIPSGYYELRASCSGFIPWTFKGFFTASKEIDIALQEGLTFLTGRVKSLEERVLGVPEYSSVVGAEISAWLNGSSDTLKTYTGSLGDFRIPIPSEGKWNVQARKASKFSNIYTSQVNKDTEVQLPEILLQYLARIKGSLTGIPTSAVTPRVWITSSGKIVQSVFAKRKSDQTWEYEFSDVPQASYQVIARATGFTPLDTPIVIFEPSGRPETRGTIEVAPIPLTSSTHQLSLHSRYHVFGLKSTSTGFATTQHLNAKWNVQIPNDTSTNAPDTILFGRGLYSYSLIPADRGWISLWNQVDSLNQPLKVDTVLWPAYHLIPDTVYPQMGDSITIKLALYEPTDSLYLHILDGEQYRDVLPKFMNQDTLVFRFKLSHPSRWLNYWFDIYSATDGRHYSNPPPFHHFIVPIQWNSLPFEIDLNLGDTVRTLTANPLHIQVSARSQFGGTNLSDALRGSGNLTWTSTPIAGCEIQKQTDDLLAAQIVLSNPGTYSLTISGELGTRSASKKITILSETQAKGKFHIFPLWIKDQINTPQNSLPLLATITDSENKQWRVQPQWELYPVNAGIISPDGILQAKSDFIGVITIKATFGNQMDSMDIPLFQWIYPNQGESVFSYDSTIRVIVADTATANLPFALGLARLNSLQKSKFNRHGKDTLNGFFNLTFPILEPAKTPTMAFQVPEDGKGSPSLYSLDTNLAQFSAIPPEEMIQSTSSAWRGVVPLKKIPTYYGILEDPDKHLTTTLSFLPNPFSPFVIAHADGNQEAGTAIHFTPYYPGLQQVFATLEILSLSGDPIRVLLKNQIRSVEEHVLYWDGTTDSGRLVHNGRYVAILSLRKSANGKIIRQVAKPVVVFR